MVVFVSTEKNDENLFVCYSKSISAPYGCMPYLGGTPAEPCSSTFFDGIFYTLRMQPLSWEHSSLVKTPYRIIIFVIVEEHKIIQCVYSFSENTKVQHKLRRAIDNIHMHVVIKTRYICPWNHLKLSLILNSEMQFAIIQLVLFFQLVRLKTSTFPCQSCPNDYKFIFSWILQKMSNANIVITNLGLDEWIEKLRFSLKKLILSKNVWVWLELIVWLELRLACKKLRT